MKTLQSEIIELTGVLPTIDPETEVENRVYFLKKYLVDSNKKGYVLGISGGQDSTLTGRLCQLAVTELREEGYDASFLALRLPYGIQHDEADAQQAIDFIQPDETINFNIKPMVDAFAQTFDAVASDGNLLTDYVKGNTKARARMVAQYAYASERGFLVPGCAHPCEYIMGFETTGGDNISDILPLGGISKRQGAQILKYLKVPDALYKKVPTADLLDGKPGQTDEAELGIAYDALDDYLEGKTVPENIRVAIEARYMKTEFKRHPPVNFVR